MTQHIPEPIIEVRDLQRTFALSRRNEVRALDGVTCELRRGTCLAVVGESGSGKSTLARIIVGLETADAGTVQLAGSELSMRPSRRELRRRAKQIQMVFQDPHGSLNRSLPVYATIREMITTHVPDLPAKEVHSRTLQYFEEVGLTERHANAMPHELSGGQKQRVAIARALAADPEVIVLDEAVSALDVSVQAQVLALLKQLRQDRGLSYLFITHDLSVVRDIADDVIVMKRGRIVERGPVDQVLDAPQDSYTKLLIDSAPRPGWKPSRVLHRRDLTEAEEV